MLCYPDRAVGEQVLAPSHGQLSLASGIKKGGPKAALFNSWYSVTRQQQRGPFQQQR
jgi:hypothetical protein